MSSFLILHGDDDIARDAALRKLRAEQYAAPNGELNTAELDGETASAGEAIAAASAYPFLADRRLVIVRGMIAHLTRKGAGETGKKQVEYLAAELPLLPAYALLVFVERQTLSDSRLLRLDKNAVKTFAVPADGTRWIIERATSEYQAKITPGAAAALAQVTTAEKKIDLRRADSELFKLVCYVENEREIVEADVEKLTPYRQEARTFDMVDALVEGRTQRAQQLLHRLLDEEDPFMVYGMVIRQFRLLLLAKEHLSTGGTPGGIREALGVAPFVADRLAKQSRPFTVDRLEKIYHLLLDYDLAVKTGRMEMTLALELLVARLAA